MSEVRWLPYGVEVQAYAVNRMTEAQASKVVFHEWPGGGGGWWERRGMAPVCRESEECIAEDDQS